MSKKLLLSLAAGCLALGAFAETATVDFTYANSDLYIYGKGKKETIDVAMCINDGSLAGMKVKAIKAYIATTVNISNCSLWMSSDLMLENKVNVADICSYDVTPEETTIGGDALGLLSVELEEAYTLTDAPVYIGYTLTVDDITSDLQKYPIVVGSDINPNGLFLHMNKSILKWTEYSSKAGGSAFIVATIEGEFPDYSLGFKSAPAVYASLDEDYTVEFQVSNIGGNEVESLTYVYSVDGGEEMTGTCQLPAPIETNLTLSSPVTLSFNALSEIGSHDLTVKITEVNGNPNQSVADEITCRVNVIPFLPKHRPLVEEYTGTWCGWCTRGFLAMEMLAEDYSNDQVSVCFHNGDPMTVTNTYPMPVSGFPCASIDRMSIIDPYYGSSSYEEFGIAIDMQNRMNEVAIAAIEVKSELVDEKVLATTTTTFIQDIDEANYQVGYLLLCNGLTSPDWAQQNYYAKEKGYEGTPLEVLTTWPGTVYDLVFNDVVVNVGAMSGAKGSLPTEIKVAEPYEHEYEMSIAGNKLVQNKENLVVVAFVVDKSNGTIVNANKCKIGTNSADADAAVDQIAGDASVVSTEYYDLVGRRVNNPSNGIFVRVQKMNDGSAKTSKVLFNK